MPATRMANTNDLTNPAKKSVMVTAVSTSFRNVTIGMENDVIVMAPPIQSHQVRKKSQQRRHQQGGDDPGVTRKRTGSSPMVVNASTS